MGHIANQTRSITGGALALWMTVTAVPVAASELSTAPEPASSSVGQEEDTTAEALERELKALRTRLAEMQSPPPSTEAAASGAPLAEPSAPGDAAVVAQDQAIQAELAELRSEIAALRQVMADSAAQRQSPPPSADREPATEASPPPELERLRRQLRALEELQQFRLELDALREEIQKQRQNLRAQTGAAEEAEIPTLSRPATSTTLIKDEQGRFGLWVNPLKWQVSTYRNNSEAQFEFRHSSGDAFAFVIAEDLSVPMDSVADVALTNAQAAASDAHLVQQETRRVNNTEVLCLQIDGTMQQSVPFTYLGYYYSGPAGAVQVVTTATTENAARYRADLEDLLNGLEIYSK
jgi:hypothetical protein